MLSCYLAIICTSAPLSASLDALKSKSLVCVKSDVWVVVCHFKNRIISQIQNNHPKRIIITKMYDAVKAARESEQQLQ
jgi:hypothetical protein